ncbi:MAG: transcription antitermination factor NusB [Firmicutes bacterium]|nr:transcription antitermination factor NusB [Bacillota bacterium]MBQ3111727.1 transcription antitermination factor NusB [Bacillota bacterium]MBR6823951.1 transcription antitermination factor NusB [Bacillota bacterium]MBR7113144.1 transcription antitermination factor NusB [Bacillota bacterium]
MTRRTARETALQMLFQLTVGENDWEMAELWQKESAEVNGESDDNAMFIAALVKGAFDQICEDDKLIAAHASGWDIDRLSEVDKAILRLAVFEMKSGVTPPPVVINEAVELAKVFASDDSPAFINAVLDSIRKELNAAAEEQQQ